ncbi:unnamed protein product [Cladocopium goreaui]|uniref:Uncharacterized protein n=1 Tax=Cladocopium goreaui TaxID=2562237 RepID=A0A9P1FFT5_9DINO|nr:unnamed protein product [Cladocopium goreaui]
MSCSKPEQVHKFASRQWSSGSLMRGLSFLNDQSKKEQVEYGDILSVAKSRLATLQAQNGQVPSTPEARVRAVTSPQDNSEKGEMSEDDLSEEEDADAPQQQKKATEEYKKLAALNAKLARICKPKAHSGRLEVSQEIHKQWMAGGEQRKSLLNILIKANGDKAVFKKEIEHMQRNRIKAVCRYCTAKSRVKTHVRRDKYERNIREFWVDVATTGAFERENEETLCDKTGAEGTAVSFDLGLPAEQPQVDDRGPPSDPDDSDAEVGSGNEDDSDRSTRTKVPRPGDVQEESVFEAHENIPEVVNNLLRVQGRMDTLYEKVSAVSSNEAQESLKKVDKYRSTLGNLHDELADLKSYFDGHIKACSEDEKFDKANLISMLR